MNGNRLFKLVWRFNAVALAVGTLMAMLLMLFAFYTIYRDKIARPIHLSGKATADTDSKEAQIDWRIGGAVVQGATIWLPLYTDASMDLGMRSKEVTSVRNFLVQHPRTGQTSWLFDGFGQIVTEYATLYDKDNRPAYVLMTVVTDDTNDDGFLSSADKQNLVYAKVESPRVTKVEDDIGKLVSQHLEGDNLLLVTETRSAELRSLVYNTSEDAIHASETVPAPTF